MKNFEIGRRRLLPQRNQFHKRNQWDVSILDGWPGSMSLRNQGLEHSILTWSTVVQESTPLLSQLPFGAEATHSNPPLIKHLPSYCICHQHYPLPLGSPNVNLENEYNIRSTLVSTFRGGEWRINGFSDVIPLVLKYFSTCRNLSTVLHWCTTTCVYSLMGGVFAAQSTLLFHVSHSTELEIDLPEIRTKEHIQVCVLCVPVRCWDLQVHFSWFEKGNGGRKVQWSERKILHMGMPLIELNYRWNIEQRFAVNDTRHQM